MPRREGIFVQKASHCGNATNESELHSSQQSEPASPLDAKSWSVILKSWVPNNVKSFLFAIWTLVLLPVGVIHLVQTGDTTILMLAFGAVCAYSGIPSGIAIVKTAFPLLWKNKN
jgi:hypothetical protein